VDDYLKAQAHGSSKKILILGDSVLYGSGLLANHARHWRQNTVAAFMRQVLGEARVVDLSMDGLLPTDYLALYQKIRKHPPEWLVLNFNYRMLAEKYRQGREAISRIWLCSNLPQEKFEFGIHPKPSDQVLDTLQRYSLLFRFAGAVRSSLFFPTREEAFTRLLKRFLPDSAFTKPLDPEMLLKLKLKPYYYSSEFSSQDYQVKAMLLLIRQFKTDKQKFFVFFTPQNLEFIQDIYQSEIFERNVQRFGRLL
jgi:hypothetical protein